eukprot:3386614-Rhodomonas_salina.1
MLSPKRYAPKDIGIPDTSDEFLGRAGSALMISAYWYLISSNSSAVSARRRVATLKTVRTAHALPKHSSKPSPTKPAGHTHMKLPSVLSHSDMYCTRRAQQARE